jgi:drug/metabolite transporter (DMT)-like permease
MKRRLYGTLYLLLATVIWGGAFVAQSTGMDYMGPFTFQAARCLLAVIALVIMTVITDCRTPWRFLKKWRDARLWKAGLLCGLALFASTNLQQVALVTTDAGKAGFITALYIVLVPLIGLVLGKRAKWHVYVCVAIAVVGLWLLCMGGSSLSLGDLLLIVCSFIFALHITVVDHFSPHVDGIRLSCIMFFTVAVISTVLAFVMEDPQWVGIGKASGAILYSGGVSAAVGYTLQILGQKHTPPTVASLLMSMESVFAVIASAILLPEIAAFSAREWIGMLVILLAIVLAQLDLDFKKKAKAE